MLNSERPNTEVTENHSETQRTTERQSRKQIYSRAAIISTASGKEPKDASMPGSRISMDSRHMRLIASAALEFTDLIFDLCLRASSPKAL